MNEITGERNERSWYLTILVSTGKAAAFSDTGTCGCARGVFAPGGAERGRRCSGSHRAAARNSRLSRDQRAEMLADLERGYEELGSDPAALREELKEGLFLDEALNDPIIEE